MVVLPADFVSQEAGRLRSHNVAADRRPQGSFNDPVTYFPYVALVLLWVFLFFRMRKLGRFGATR